MPQRPIGIFGGTFDPIHLGHLRTAHELLTGLGLAEVRFVPARLPPHRPATVAPEALRLRMLEAALEGLPGFRVDGRELRRPGPSFMVDTLVSLRSEVGASHSACCWASTRSSVCLPGIGGVNCRSWPTSWWRAALASPGRLTASSRVRPASSRAPA